jgi:hypothetical protein
MLERMLLFMTDSWAIMSSWALMGTAVVSPCVLLHSTLLLTCW